MKALTIVECWRSVCLPVHMALLSFRAYDDMRECCEGVVATRVAKSPKRIFRQVLHEIDPTDVPIEGNLPMFPRCPYSTCSAHCNHETVNRLIYYGGYADMERTKMSAHCKTDIV